MCTQGAVPSRECSQAAPNKGCGLFWRVSPSCPCPSGSASTAGTGWAGTSGGKEPCFPSRPRQNQECLGGSGEQEGQMEMGSSEGSLSKVRERVTGSPSSPWGGLSLLPYGRGGACVKGGLEGSRSFPHCYSLKCPLEVSLTQQLHCLAGPGQGSPCPC